MTFFSKNILCTWFFLDSGSPVHGKSNDTLCASNRSKLVEKYKLEESCFDLFRKKLKYTGAGILNKMNFEIDLQCLPIDFKNSLWKLQKFFFQIVRSARILLFSVKKLNGESG